MKSEINNFCAKIGRNPLLVQGAGGNVSWKEGDIIWVKSSGTWLADALEKEIFLPVDYNDLKIQIAAGNFDAQAKPLTDAAGRPSIETMLHALMPQKVVVHLHAVEALAYLVRENGFAELRHKLKGLKTAEVGYHKPGAELARAIAEALKARPVDIVLLQNHGIVIGAETIDGVQKILDEVVTRLALAVVSKAYESRHAPEGYVAYGDNEVQALAFDDVLFSHVQKHWAVFPDHVVFMGPKAFCYNSPEEAGTGHELVFIKDHGIFVKNDFSKAKQVQLRCYYDMIIRQPENAVLKVLDDRQIAALLNWDAEHYRMQINKV